MYINGHFCYAYKFGIVTNGLGIVRDITFYNKEFLKAHPDIVVEKKSDSPDEDKSLADSKALLPVLVDFFQKHPLIAPKTFLGDAAFDTLEIYKTLFGEIGFEKAFIPLRVKLSVEDNGYTINENMLAKPVGKDICQRLCFLCIAGCFTAVVFAHRSHLRYEQRM